MVVSLWCSLSSWLSAAGSGGGGVGIAAVAVAASDVVVAGVVGCAAAAVVVAVVVVCICVFASVLQNAWAVARWPRSSARALGVRVTLRTGNPRCRSAAGQWVLCR